MKKDDNKPQPMRSYMCDSKLDSIEYKIDTLRTLLARAYVKNEQYERVKQKNKK